MSTYFVGTVFRTSARWDSIAVAPQAPGNYKNAEKIAEYIAKARESQQFEAMFVPLTAQLSSVCVLDDRNDVVYNSRDGDRNVGVAFVSWLQTKFPDHFGDALRDAEAYPSNILLGFGLKQALKVAAFEVLALNRHHSIKIPVPVKLWYKPVGVYDPEDVLLTSKDEKLLDLPTVAHELGVVLPDDWGSNARTNAFVCSELAAATQLIPVYTGSQVS